MTSKQLLCDSFSIAACAFPYWLRCQFGSFFISLQGAAPIAGRSHPHAPPPAPPPLPHLLAAPRPWWSPSSAMAMQTLVQALLHALAQRCAASVTRVVLTLNVPEPPPQAPAHGWPFTLEVRHNARPLGFGQQPQPGPGPGYRGFRVRAQPRRCACALMGLILWRRWSAQHTRRVWAAPTHCKWTPKGGCKTASAPCPRWLRCGSGACVGAASSGWIGSNGACLVLPRPVWQALGGFDTRYFMYCEDVDLCLRLRLQGWQLVRAAAQVQHQGSRASRRAWQPLAWHIHSLLRLWASPVFWRARTLSPLPLAAAPAAPAPATAPPPAAP